MALASPCLELTRELHLPDLPKHKVLLFSHGRRLLVLPRQVIIVHGVVVAQRLTYDEDVLAAAYVRFESDSAPDSAPNAYQQATHDTHDRRHTRESFRDSAHDGTFDSCGESKGDDAVDSLVVVLRRGAYVYQRPGRTHMVSFPISVRAAYAFGTGVLLQRDCDATTTEPRFFTLVHPRADLCVVTTSSTSVVSAHESVLYFPNGLDKALTLCATYNTRLRTINVYFVRAALRAKHAGYARRRSTLSASSPAGARIWDDDIHDADGAGSFAGSLGAGHGAGSYGSQPHGPTPLSAAPSMSMDKKRTSTLLSGVSSMARMGSESTAGDAASGVPRVPLDLGALRKNMIWTKVGLFASGAKRLHLAVSGLAFDGRTAVVVTNRHSQKTKVYIYNQRAGNAPLYESTYQMRCLYATSLHHAAVPGWMAVLVSDSLLRLVHPVLELEAPPVSFAGRLPRMSLIAGSAANTLALRSSTETRRTYLVSLVLEPTNRAVSACLRTWQYLSGSKINEQVKVLWRTAAMRDAHKDEWNAYVVTLLALIYPFEERPHSEVGNPQEDGTERAVPHAPHAVDHSVQKTAEQEPETKETPLLNDVTAQLSAAHALRTYALINYALYDLLPFAVVALHLVYEELRLDRLQAGMLNRLGTLLAQLTAWMGWSDAWVSHYGIDLSYIDRHVRLLLVVLVARPPDVIGHLASAVEGRAEPLLTFAQLVEESDAVNRIVTPTTHALCALFRLLGTRETSRAAVIRAMAEFGIGAAFLDTLPAALALPLKNYLLQCQDRPELEWNAQMLELAGRRDVTALLEPEFSFSGGADIPVDRSGLTDSRDAHAVLGGAHVAENFLPWDGQAEADRVQVTRLIFDRDRRYYEITSLLHQTRTQTATERGPEDGNEYASMLVRRTVAALVGVRTVTMPLGRAALFYGGRMPFLTEKFPIPKFNLNTVLLPARTTIVLQEDAIPLRVMEWGHFHNGVLAGLSISPHAKGITGSWVNFNKPKENNAQHAGFLLGLGLNGHLKRLEEWHIYNYLGPKHPLTSVGLLLGMATSLRASKDNKLTKVLSVHAVALLPQGANDLNVPLVVQAAGLVGIGLLYLETQHRRMSEILLAQVGELCTHADAFEEHESYRLAAGIGLGLINLGKGNDLRGLSGTNVVDTLLAHAVSMRDSHAHADAPHSGAPTAGFAAQCGSAAIVALGLIYLRTGNRTIAAKLAVPDSEPLMDYVRPDLLLLRYIARGLILWDDIRDTREWVDAQMPAVLRRKHNMAHISALDSDHIAYFYVLAGACLAVAMRYASSQNTRARDTLLHYLDLCMALSRTRAVNYDQRIAHGALAQLENVLCVAVAVVMAASGDLAVFRRLRVLHGRIDENVDYGCHMAYSTALGHLFLGGGQYGFAKTNFAVAALVVSLYPVYPRERSDHEVHLQALRHFWALAVEPYCLVVRDVTDGAPVAVPVRVTMANGTVRQELAPCLLPSVDDIAHLQVESPQFFRVEIDFSVNSAYLERFKSSLVVYVLRKQNYETLRVSMATLLHHSNRTLVQGAARHDTETVARILNAAVARLLSSFDKAVYLETAASNLHRGATHGPTTGLSVCNIIDTKLELARLALPLSVHDLADLSFLFAYADRVCTRDLCYVDAHCVEWLKDKMRAYAQAVRM